MRLLQPIASPAGSTRFAEETPRIARSIIDGSMSPYCPGLTLAACPSPTADSLRQAIIGRVRAGESQASIERGLEAVYGTAIRATPDARGFGVLGWAVPWVAFALGALWVTRVLTRMRQRSS